MIEPCDDAISRKEVIKIIEDAETARLRGNIDLLYAPILKKVNELPSVTPQQKYGKWIDYSDEGFVECPFCGHATNCEDNIDELHYCFNCGAKMESEVEE